MILQQLYHDAGAILKESLPPPMYDTRPVRWVIQLTPDGKRLNFQPLGGSKENKRGLPHLLPYPGPRSGNVIRPALLADTPAFVLGVAPEDSRAAVKHAAFKALVHRCAQETHDPLVAAVDTFLSTWDPTADNDLPSELTSADTLSFQVGDEWPVDAEDVQTFWARTARPAPETTTVSLAQCLVTGLLGPTEKSLPGTLKRIPGGQSSGVALVSANEAAYESYGLERAQTSPISSDAAERFTKALNHLIAGERTHLTIGNLVYVFWTREGEDDGFFDLINEARPEQVQSLLAAYRSGERKYTHLDTEAFYAFALSASGARAVIRDWLTTTVGDARVRLAQWFDIHEMITPDGSATGHFPLKKLPYALYRDPNKEQTIQTTQALVRAAVHGDPVPRSLLDRAVMRCRAEQRVTQSRAAVMKAVLVRLNSPDTNSYSPEEAQRMTQLDTKTPEPAYLCGRLLAELEVVQRAALGRTNTTLVDRYFGAASTTPATVFGILLTNANKAHLPKIRKQNEGTYNALQNRIAEITAPLKGFPATLTLAQQALFSLGYYHQRAADRAAAQAAAERKRQGQATAADEVIIAATDDTDTQPLED